VDTNILVYISNQSSPFHLKALNAFVEIRNHYELWISRQVLREFAVVVSRPDFAEHPADSDSLISALTKWSKIFLVADETDAVTQKLIQLISDYNIKGKRIHDANIVATMMTNKIANILTMNAADFNGFNEISVMSLAL